MPESVNPYSWGSVSHQELPSVRVVAQEKPDSLFSERGAAGLGHYDDITEFDTSTAKQPMTPKATARVVEWASK